VAYQESGLGLKVGFVKYIHHFFFDLNSGLAIRFIDYDKPHITRNPEEDEGQWFDIPREEDRTGFMPLICMRLGYRLR
jgi:hypothetical protein